MNVQLTRLPNHKIKNNPSRIDMTLKPISQSDFIIEMH